MEKEQKLGVKMQKGMSNGRKEERTRVKLERVECEWGLPERDGGGGVCDEKLFVVVVVVGGDGLGSECTELHCFGGWSWISETLRLLMI